MNRAQVSSMIGGTWKYVLYFIVLAIPIFYISEIQIADVTVLWWVIPGGYFETFLLLAGFGLAIWLTAIIGRMGKFGWKKGGY